MKRVSGIPLISLLTLTAVAGILLFRNDPPDRTDASAPITRRANRPIPDREIPVTVIHPEDLGVAAPGTPANSPARIARAISENDLPAIQSAALSWFEQDPAAARDWLAGQPTLEDLQPAISYIARKVSENGDIGTALEWTKLLPDGTLRDDTVFDIHALALRNGGIAPSQIQLDEIPPGRRDELLSGAAGD